MAPSESRIEWGEVTCQAERILIVATGPSANAIPVSDIAAAGRAGAHVIAVNGALRWVPRIDSWFSLDPDRRVLPLLEPRIAGTTYYMAVPADYGSPEAAVWYHRCEPPRGIVYLRRLVGTGPMKSRGHLSEQPTAINTGNSAWGALGLAYLMRPKRIAFIGLDGTKMPYAHRPEEAPAGSLRHLPSLFRTALRQLRGIDVVNGSPASRVKCFARTSPQEALRWIVE